MLHIYFLLGFKSKIKYKNPIIFCIFILLSLCIEAETEGIIVFPFKISVINQNPEKESYNGTDFVSDNFFRDMYTNIQIGTPTQKVLTVLSPSNHFFIFDEESCKMKTLSKIYDPDNEISKDKYNYQRSDSYTNITVREYYYEKLKEATISSEKFLFLNKSNENLPIDAETINFIIAENTHEQICGTIGLNKPLSEYDGPPHFIDSLKKKGIIQNESWTLKFLTPYTGEFILGAEPHEYEDISKDPSYQIKNFFKTESDSIIEIFNPWSFISQKIYYYKNKNNEDIALVNELNSCYLRYDYGFILGTQYYKDNITLSFFDKLFNLDICKMDEVQNADEPLSYTTYYLISCDKKKLTEGKINYLKEFPSLYIYVNNYDFSFELTSNELFKNVNDKYYFMVLFTKPVFHIDDTWYLGLPFLQKYQFVFNYDAKTIGFYIPQPKENEKEDDNKNKEKEKNKKFYQTTIFQIIVGALLMSVLLVLAYFIGRTQLNKRQKRANELKDDDYLYEQDDERNDETLSKNKSDDKKVELIH